MVRVPLHLFVKFMTASLEKKLDLVRRFKDRQHRPPTDYYGPLRDAIVDMHARSFPSSALDAFLRTVNDQKRRIYTPFVDGYRRFLRPDMQWFAPPHTTLPIGDLEVDIRPDLGFLIDGAPHVITMAFGPWSDDAARLTRMLTVAALGYSRPKAMFAVLDVARGRTAVSTAVPHPRLGLLARGESASFSTMYAAI